MPRQKAVSPLAQNLPNEDKPSIGRASLHRFNLH